MIEDEPIFLAVRVRDLGDEGRALYLEMGVKQVLGFEIDITRMFTWASQQNQNWAYAHVRIGTVRIDDRRHHPIFVEYSLPVSAVDRDSLFEIVKVMQSAHRATWKKVKFEISARRRKDLAAGESTIKTRQVMDELDRLVGLAPVKSHIRRLAMRQHVANLRAEKGFRVVTTSPHLVFTGNPGTGKTTVARQVGKLYHSLGLLDRGHVVEVDRSDLVAAYLGQTALKTTEVCQKALGGVLFVDEAYGLDVDGRDYGQEAIEALLKFMEDNRGNIAVIVAGYPAEMEAFIDSNPGLRSRFDTTLHFPDYSDDELLRIFHRLVASHDYRLGVGVDELVTKIFAAMPRGSGFGNAREVRRLFDEVVCNHAMTMRGIPHPTERQLELITSRAIEMTSRPIAAEPERRESSWSGYL